MATLRHNPGSTLVKFTVPRTVAVTVRMIFFPPNNRVDGFAYLGMLWGDEQDETMEIYMEKAMSL